MTQAERADLPLFDLVADARHRVAAIDADLLQYFDVYAEEARFARRLIDGALSRLQPGAAVLEVGAGSFLLSVQLRQEGFAVTAIEPHGTGFSHLATIGAIVLDVAGDSGCRPEVYAQPAETFDPEGTTFSYAFSINAMEHVLDVDATIDHVVASLAPGAEFRFICPNYRFPYEPHFNIPTLFSKRLTWRCLRRWIIERPDMPDPAGTWDSLNWITTGDVINACRARSDVTVRFDHAALERFVERCVSDEKFRDRKGEGVVRVAAAARRLRLARLARRLPPRVAPVIDCSITRRSVTH